MSKTTREVRVSDGAIRIVGPMGMVYWQPRFRIVTIEVEDSEDPDDAGDREHTS